MVSLTYDEIANYIQLNYDPDDYTDIDDLFDDISLDFNIPKSQARDFAQEFWEVWAEEELIDEEEELDEEESIELSREYEEDRRIEQERRFQEEEIEKAEIQIDEAEERIREGMIALERLEERPKPKPSLTKRITKSIRGFISRLFR